VLPLWGDHARGLDERRGRSSGDLISRLLGGFGWSRVGNWVWFFDDECRFIEALVMNGRHIYWECFIIGFLVVWVL